MSKFQLSNTRLFEGIWEGRLVRLGKGSEQPELAVTYLDQPVPDVTLVSGPGENEWMLRVPVPAESLSDGVQTFLIADANTDETLDQFHMICGEPLDEDLRSEVSLLRAELDMLKRAFRRHCLETT